MTLLSESLFSDDAIPPTDEEPIVTTSDRTCEVCGEPLLYSGKGRPPTRCDEHKKSGNKRATNSAPSGRRSATREVDTALASFDQLNAMIATVLLFVSPDAAAFFSSQGERLQERNRIVLEANPDLAKKVAKVTGKTGGLGLAVSYGMVIVPTFGIIKAEREAQYAADLPPEA